MIIQNIQQKIILIFSKINQHKKIKIREVFIFHLYQHTKTINQDIKSKFEIENFVLKKKYNN